MSRFGKYKSLIAILFIIVLLEFAALAGALAADGARRAETEELRSSLAVLAEEREERPEPAEPDPEPVLPPEKPKPAGERTAEEILSGQPVIAHAMGAVGEEAVLNCLEGFQAQYRAGVRVFEADLRLTSDQQVVLRHDWRSGWQEGVSETEIPTLEEFRSKPILEKYTPLTFRDLLLLMEEYPDICVVTDTKFTDAEVVRLQFEAMLRDARELGLSYLFDRFVIQIYDPLMFQVVDGLHHFGCYLFTLYNIGFSKTEEEFRERAAFCRENGILGITMQESWWRGAYAPIAEEYGIRLFLHTVNDCATARVLLSNGVSAVYSDYLRPVEVKPPEDRLPVQGGIRYEPY